MKKCSYCGRENPDNAVNCFECGTDEFESNAPAQAEKNDDLDELVTLTTCQKLADADLIRAKLDAAGIEAFIPDEHLMQNIGFNLNTYGYVRVQVRRQDYASAKELLPEPADTPADPQIALAGDKKVIASMEMGQLLLDIMQRLKQQGIPAEIRTTLQESGLDISEIVVEDSYYDRGCDVVEAWDAERLAAVKKQDKIRCDQCGSKNYALIPHDKLKFVYQCKDCGNEFLVGRVDFQ
jgi:hypothetical protein